jgi:hypothetical protein
VLQIASRASHWRALNSISGRSYGRGGAACNTPRMCAQCMAGVATAVA